jgi:glycosyltransferase involved in cell wall biosynthesis
MSRSTRTWKEQFGRVIMEAQACGVPVIGSDSGNIPSVISGGGWTVPEGDVAALATLLDNLSGNSEARAQASCIALHQASTRYAPGTVGKALSSAYNLAATVRSRATGLTAGHDCLTKAV